MSEDTIDLWGVREQLVAYVPGLNLADLPGVSNPADHHRLKSLSEARERPDGIVLLSAYGTSHLFVVARAGIVACDEDALQRLASDVAPIWDEVGHQDAAAGNPRSHFFAIAPYERVWNMECGGVRHARLDADLWVADSLQARVEDIRDVLSGERPSIAAP